MRLLMFVTVRQNWTLTDSMKLMEENLVIYKEILFFVFTNLEIMSNHYRKISIANFRGFDHLIINDFANVNVFVGANNVGKTSILEALFMLAGMSNPLMPARINYWRTLTAPTVDGVRYLFHNLDFSNKPILEADMLTGVRKLTFTPVMANDDADVTSSGMSSRSAIKQLDLDFDVIEGNGYTYHAKLYTDAGGNMQQMVDDSYREDMNCLFVSADKNDNNATSNFALLVKRNRKQEVVKALRNFDASIESVEALPDGLFMKIKAVQELMPISMAGDGIRRMVNILSTIANEDYHTVLIDEIDNGLHYSAHKCMWRTILDFARQRNVQIFVTTHNLDCLQGLKNVIQENDTFQELVHVYNIAKTKNRGFQAYKYTYVELKEAIDNEIEIRR